MQIPELRKRKLNILNNLHKGKKEEKSNGKHVDQIENAQENNDHKPK